MTRDQLAERLTERSFVPGQFEGVPEDVLVRGGGLAPAAVVEQAELEPGERPGVLGAFQPGPVHPGHEGERGGCGAVVRRGRLFGPCGQPRHRRVPDEVGEGEAQAPGLGPGTHAEHEDGVSAEREVVVVDADVLPAQHLGPDLGEYGLGAAPRRPAAVRGRGVAGLGQRAAVGLPVGGQRYGVDPREVGRDHERRQGPRERLAQPCVVQVGVGDVVADEVGAAVGGAAVHDDGVTDAGQRAQGARDLTRLHAVAPDLDLAVDPPEVLQGAVRQPACEVAGAVEASAGRERVLDELLGGQFRSVQVAPGDTDTTDAQLAGDA